MKESNAVIKCRHLLGRLAPLGIEASRGTGVGAEVPDAVLISREGRAWLVALWGGASVQPELFGEEEGGMGTLDEVVARLIRWRDSQIESGLGPAPGLLILAPGIPAKEVTRGGVQFKGECVPVIPREACKKEAVLAGAILGHLSAVLDAGTVARWRAAVAPEVRVDSRYRRRSVVRERGASAAPLLLDYRQERCVRLDLEPGEEGKGLVGDLKVRVITGVAGCGKTLVLLHRAVLLARRFPRARVVLVTHNAALASELAQRLDRLGAGKSVACLTFYKWLSGVRPAGGEMMKGREVVEWIEGERRRAGYPALEKMTGEWIAEEMTWMCDHRCAGEKYLEVVRKGRKTRLSRRQRREMLQLLSRFRKHLRKTGRGEWSEWPLRVAEEGLGFPSDQRMDHLLIDEAQFFAPVWLELLRAALRAGGHLFLCADPTQGFLRRQISWSAMGLEVRNRTHRLERPYRSTRAILEFAGNFYRRRLPEDEEPLNLPAQEWLEGLEQGVAPIVQPAGPGQDQVARLGNELKELRDQGVALGDVLILVAGRKILPEELVKQLCAKLGPDAAGLVKDRKAPLKGAGVVHLMGATGLERPLVFLMGIDEMAEAELDPRLAPGDLAEMERDHTRMVYVGLTRAMERLVIYSGHPRWRASFFPEGEGELERCA